MDVAQAPGGQDETAVRRRERRPADAFQAELILGRWSASPPPLPVPAEPEPEAGRRGAVVAFLALLLLLLTLLLLGPILGGDDAG